jgi:GNAT superfamily N-acetyltransferase
VNHRFANEADLDLLAHWNRQLIEDEGHDNPMNVGQLRERMCDWMKNKYQVVIFCESDLPCAYATFRNEDGQVYLRQFFVDRGQRRRGIGKQAFSLLLHAVHPPHQRVVVEVMAWNSHGRAFWEAVGFRSRYVGMELKP